MREATAGRRRGLVGCVGASLKEKLKKILRGQWTFLSPARLNVLNIYTCILFILKQIQQIAVICFLYINFYFITFYAHVTFFFLVLSSPLAHSLSQLTKFPGAISWRNFALYMNKGGTFAWLFAESEEWHLDHAITLACMWVQKKCIRIHICIDARNISAK